ncbi:hypothetical protein [Lactobacillus helveticus]|uniref:hypothetical protein n=1 Tax=Lactobacillus helveticus TaxID=1587 RepID=UPI000D7C5F03|nr:hypothetical protein [Lactobacillus helveticus]NRO69048.1 hypothetical protein [Lactobacillus helveticus]NRO70900.1 hypothetical protein [Lactobacillus helveticus]PXZ18960.1 hypothetical protein DM474_08770 [Lactobacillus helveticus]
MTHNYQFASIADNTHGPIPTNIEISEQVFNNYYVLIRHLKPLTNLYKVFNMVKTERWTLAELPKRFYDNKIPFNTLLDYAERHAILYVIMHIIFIHNAQNFIEHNLDKKQIFKESKHCRNIRAIRNYADHCNVPITTSGFNLELSNSKMTLSFPLTVKKEDLVSFDDLHKETRKIINSWKNHEIRLDLEIASAWKDLVFLFNKIKEEYVKKFVPKDSLKQVVDDKALFGQQLFPMRITGVLDLHPQHKGWNFEYFEDDTVFNDLINLILKMNTNAIN